MNYLNVGNYDLGILVNFGTYPKAYVQRIVRKGASLNSVEEEEPPYYFE